MKLDKLEQRMGYTFQNRAYLELALTHSSYGNEHTGCKSGSNERLEFLGDAVLELGSSEFLFQRFEQEPEGRLTRLRASMVCEPSLAFCARELSLGDFLMLGRGEENTGGRERDSILSDTLEAVIGAIYLDGGLSAARAFIENHVLNDLERKKLFYDSKTILQEMVQKGGSNPLSYHLVSETGPDHDKRFCTEVRMEGRVLGCGSGHTKKASEQQAAYQALLALLEADKE